VSQESRKEETSCSGQDHSHQEQGLERQRGMLDLHPTVTNTLNNTMTHRFFTLHSGVGHSQTNSVSESDRHSQEEVEGHALRVPT